MPLTHTPSLPILLYISLLAPFIAWDSAYVFLRPHSFPSGKYASYFTHMVDGAEVDRLYSQAAWRAGDDGVIVAQAVLSMVEVGLYLAYVGMVLWRVGLGGLIKRRMLRGEEGKWVVLVGFAAGVLGGTKTAQYCKFSSLVDYPEEKGVDLHVSFERGCKWVQIYGA
jgi:hypothetical protein|tara:strand:- start:24899 stop:25399 length:501 start_codon:yes stop_codon:yes gene_type:complete